MSEQVIVSSESLSVPVEPVPPAPPAPVNPVTSVTSAATAEPSTDTTDTAATSEADFPSSWYYHDFAMLIKVTPEDRLDAWEAALQAAEPEPDMSVNIRKATLVMFAIKADVEFLALDRATEWLNGIAATLDPPVTLAFNAQPSEEV
ncbi:MAG: hypothetical protein OHK0029_40760 [Armatimonadaceae bacterium]